MEERMPVYLDFHRTAFMVKRQRRMGKSLDSSDKRADKGIPRI